MKLQFSPITADNEKTKLTKTYSPVTQGLLCPICGRTANITICILSKLVQSHQADWAELREDAVFFRKTEVPLYYRWKNPHLEASWEHLILTRTSLWQLGRIIKRFSPKPWSLSSCEVAAGHNERWGGGAGGSQWECPSWREDSNACHYKCQDTNVNGQLLHFLTTALLAEQRPAW